MKSLTVAAAAALVLMLGGCVSKQTHEATLQELESTRTSLQAAEQTIATQEGQIAANRAEIDRSESELAALQAKRTALQAELDASQEDLSVIRSQMQTLKQIEEETQKRNAIYASFVDKLQGMIDGGRLTVSIENGRIVINLPEKVLFASGSAELNDEGKTALKEIAGVLGDFSDRRFQVEGHTDNIPIKSSSGYSNWELSSDRALSVVHLMSEAGVDAKNLSAAGFGEFQPRADNGTKEGRALNRRIEIVMLPNLEILSDELPKVASK
jgi:chemotaxis protein MotB